MRARFDLCLQYLKGGTLQVRLCGLMELGKAIHRMHLSHNHQQQQRQMALIAHQKVLA